MGDYLTIDEIRSLVVILLITWGATEWAKRACRLRGRLRGQWSPRATALVIGLASSQWIWPAASSLPGWQVGLAVGIGWPGVYAIGIAVLRAKWPEAADRISGGQR